MDDKLAQKPGTRLGAYEIVRLIGRGGMAFIYEARHTALGKRVAIKILYEHLAANAVAAARFEREGRAAARIRHPNVIEIFEVGSHDGIPYLVMELLEGTDLADHLAARGALPVAEAVDLLLPAISGVAAAHAAGVVHRDLKPSNVYLALERRSGVCPKVVDFGISKLPVAGEHGLTETEMLLGTAQYMAPEHAKSPKNADARSDQYALGAILYECTTGQKPFEGESTYDLLHAIVTAPLPSPSTFASHLEPTLEAAILKAMSRDPGERYASVEEFGHAIAPFASDAGKGWRSEFEGSGARVVLSDGQAHGLAATVSLLGTTVPESPSQPARSTRGRSAVVALLGLSVVAVPAALLASRRGTAPVGPSAASVVEADVSRSPRFEAQPVPDTPPLASESVGPRDETSLPPRPESPPRRSSRGIAIPTASGLNPVAPSSAPAAPASERPVERGFNGAPIVE